VLDRQSVRAGPRARAASLEVEHLEKVFGGNKVVDDVSFSLGGGELLTLLGPSGSGKTTTMRMIAGFEEPTSGLIRVGGESVLDQPVHRRNIGVVFQQYALFPHLNVFRNVAYPLEMRRIGKPEIARRVANALEMVRLTGFEGRLPRELSGGQQQRVALARAIVFEPRLLLMDEPMGALDKRLREVMQVEIRRLQQQLGITTVSVTHDQVEALVMSDLIAVLSGGVLQQLGRPLEVYQRPANRFVADFLGESNLIEVMRWDSVDGSPLAISKGGSAMRVDAHIARDGQPAAWLIVRPENILIGAAAEAMANRYEAEVKESLYVGDLVKYKLTLASGDELTVKALASSGEPWAAGRRVTVGWRSEHCLPVAA
jgi:putative spermidine/putrescine transport system ATP-binding protein